MDTFPGVYCYAFSEFVIGEACGNHEISSGSCHVSH